MRLLYRIMIQLSYEATVYDYNDTVELFIIYKFFVCLKFQTYFSYDNTYLTFLYSYFLQYYFRSTTKKRTLIFFSSKFSLTFIFVTFFFSINYFHQFYFIIKFLLVKHFNLLFGCESIF